MIANHTINIIPDTRNLDLPNKAHVTLTDANGTVYKLPGYLNHAIHEALVAIKNRRNVDIVLMPDEISAADTARILDCEPEQVSELEEQGYIKGTDSDKGARRYFKDSVLKLRRGLYTGNV